MAALFVLGAAVRGQRPKAPVLATQPTTVHGEAREQGPSSVRQSD
jgi:hypothetical protein